MEKGIPDKGCTIKQVDKAGQSPYPVAAMRCHLIRLTPFGTFPSRGRLCLSQHLSSPPLLLAPIT